MSYEVKTRVFEGPLALLLQLITSHQVEITELSLVDLVGEYLLHLELLEEMGVLGELEAEGAVQWVRSGGLVSPSGLSFVSPDEGFRQSAPRVAAIRRRICDERIARAAQGRGAELFEDASVRETTFRDHWTVRCKDGRYEIVQDLEVSDFSRERMTATEVELREERAAIEELL